MELIDKLKYRIKKSKKTPAIIFPESEDDRILKAAASSLREGIAIPVFVGAEEEIINRAENIGVDLSASKFLPRKLNSSKENILRLAADYLMKEKADALVAGASYTSKEVILTAINNIGAENDNSIISSFFLLDIPRFSGGENGCIIFSDSAVNIDPSVEDLVKIAADSAKSALRYFGWDPRVAFISFSTKGSASHDKQAKVAKATELASKRYPDFTFDGEMQVDAALDKRVAEKKLGKIGSVAGRANVLVFPDLDSANSSYKVAKILAHAKSYGPILQGIKKPLSDLSRGASVEDIEGTIAIISSGIIS